jgi:hypothetical protein
MANQIKPTYELTADDLGEVETTESRIQRAAAHISAVDTGGDEWAHYAAETGRWYLVSGDELESLCDYLDDPDPRVSRDAYSHWCAGTGAGAEMPKEWSP